jgi:transposase
MLTSEEKKNKYKEAKAGIIESSKTDLEIKEKLKKFKKTKRMNAKNKFVLNQLSHYKFKEHLLYKSEAKCCNIFIVTEEYTSKCCGKCGICSNDYSETRVKKCPNCNSEIDRDINGARNILIKNRWYENSTQDTNGKKIKRSTYSRSGLEPDAVIPLTGEFLTFHG